MFYKIFCNYYCSIRFDSDFLQEYVFGFFSKRAHLIIFVFSLNLYIHWDIQAAVGLRPGKFFFCNCRFEWNVTHFYFFAKISVLQGVQWNMCFGYLVLYPKYILLKIDFFLLKSCVISVGICGIKNFMGYLTARLSNFTFGHPVNVLFASIELKIDQNRSFFL